MRFCQTLKRGRSMTCLGKTLRREGSQVVVEDLMTSTSTSMTSSRTLTMHSTPTSEVASMEVPTEATRAAVIAAMASLTLTTSLMTLMMMSLDHLIHSLVGIMDLVAMGSKTATSHIMVALVTSFKSSPTITSIRRCIIACTVTTTTTSILITLASPVHLDLQVKINFYQGRF